MSFFSGGPCTFSSSLLDFEIQILVFEYTVSRSLVGYLHSLLRCPSPLIYSYTRSVTVFSLQVIAWPDHASAVLMKKTSRRGKAELPCPFWGREREGGISFAGQQKHGKGEISQGRYWQQLVIGKFAGRGNFSHPSLFGPFLVLENKTVRRGKNRTEPCASF